MATWRLLFPNNSVNLSCIRRLATTQDSVTSKLKHDKEALPSKPKKPTNPFMQYLLSVRSNLQNQYPKYSYKDIVKKAAEQWAQLDSVTKQNLQKQYTEQYSIYKQKLIDYEKSLTTDQKLLIEEEFTRKELAKEKREHAKEKSQIKQKLEELGKPKRPLSAFILFMQSKKITKDPEVSQKEWMSNISKEWRDMTEEVKTKYMNQAKHLAEKYKAELQKWEEDMIKAGHHDLVKSNVKSKRATSIDLDINTQSKENIKMGWGTDIAQCKPENVPGADQQCESTKSSVFYDKNNSKRLVTKYSSDNQDTSINNASNSVVEPRGTYTRVHEYLASLWKKVLTILKEASQNWKTVREYVFLGTVALLISIFCVLNLMYK